MKIIITESQLNRLNEDITAGRIIVYHRTGKFGFNPSKDIADTGYIVSTGNHYGYGVYTTYDLESQMGDNMKNNYGPIIIESQILDTSKFLIFNYDIAKKIYKSRYRFIDQLKQILGKKEWLKYKDYSIIKNFDYRLEQGNIVYTSNIAYDFYESFKDSILQKLNGMIFTGGNDGNVLVSYNRRNIEPLRYSEDDGKTWTNIRNIKTYQRIKEPDDYKKDQEFQYLLNKIEVDPRFDIKNIPSKYYEYLLNYFSKKDNNKLNHNEFELINNIKFIKKFGSYDIFKILNNSTDKKQTAIELIEIGGDRLTSKNWYSILSYFTTPDNKSLINIDVLIIKIIDLKGKELNTQDVEHLLKRSTDKDLIATKIIDLKGDKLKSGEIYRLLEYSTDKEIITTKIIEIKGEKLTDENIQYLLSYLGIPYIRSLIDIDILIKKIIDLKGKEISSMDISYLLDYSTDKDLIVAKIIDLKGKKLNSQEISFLLHYSTDKSPISIKIIDLKGKELDSEDVRYLLIYSEDKDLIVAKIIDLKGKELSSSDINNLLYFSKDKELIKKTLLQKGVDYKLINVMIKVNKIKTPLIPDNYQEMLNEIKRIKEIIR
jgi:hypothetical protein